MNYPNPFVYNETVNADIRSATIPSLLPQQYSQCGEDLIVLSLLTTMISKGQLPDLNTCVVVEVGANHAFAGSNSYLLSKKLGLRSILIEANPSLIEELVRARPLDQVIHAAIVDGDEKDVDLCVAPSHELSSLTQRFVAEWHSGIMGGGEMVRVPAMRLNECLALHVGFGKHIVYLSIDVEGKDLSIIKTLDFTHWKPLLVQLEPSEHYSPGESARMIEFMSLRGYTLLAKTDVNLLFACAGRLGLFPNSDGAPKAISHRSDSFSQPQEIMISREDDVAKDECSLSVTHANSKPCIAYDCQYIKLIEHDPFNNWTADKKFIEHAASSGRLNNAITLDIFDTALTRVKHESPVDVFAEVESCLIQSVGKAAKGFALAREAAERMARERQHKLTKAEEVTFEQIYAELPQLLPDIEDWSLLMQTELAVERSTLRAVPDVLELTRRLKAQDTPYAFVSDMYLPRTFLEEVLSENGYADWTYVLVSNELNATKATGSIWKHVKAELGDQLCHIGDDKHADVNHPKHYGITTIHYPRARSSRRTTQRLDEATVVGSRLRRYLSLRERAQGEKVAFDLATRWYQLGQAFGGIVVGAFVQWLAEKVKTQHIDRLYFCARDGYLMKQAWDASGLSAGLDVETHYIYISRQALLIPAGIQSSTPDHLSRTLLDFLVSAYDNITVLQLLERCGIAQDSAVIRAASEIYGTDLNKAIVSWKQAEELRTLLQGFSAKIYEALSPRLANCRAYLRQEGLYNTGQCAIVDMGWHGSMQASLRELLLADSSKASLEGFYYGLWPAAGGNRYAAGPMQACFANDFIPAEKQAAVWFGVPFMEQLHSAAHGSTLHYALGDDHLMHPVFQASEPEAQQHSAHTQYFQAGVVSAVEQILGAAETKLPVSPHELTPAAGVAAMDALFLSPLDEEIQLLQHIGHCSDYDHATHVPILDPIIPTDADAVERVFPPCESKIGQLRLWLQPGTPDVAWVSRMAHERLGVLGERVLRQFNIKG